MELTERSNPADRLRRRYLLGLGLVALLAVVGTLVIRVMVGRWAADAPTLIGLKGGLYIPPVSQDADFAPTRS